MNDSFQKEDVPYKEFLKDLGFFIIKNNFPIQFVENIWLNHLALYLCAKLNFPLENNLHKKYYQC
jgi:hypothetical protein